DEISAYRLCPLCRQHLVVSVGANRPGIATYRDLLTIGHTLAQCIDHALQLVAPLRVDAGQIVAVKSEQRRYRQQRCWRRGKLIAALRMPVEAARDHVRIKENLELTQAYFIRCRVAQVEHVIPLTYTDRAFMEMRRADQ